MAPTTPMALEADEQTEKRARWEAFAFVLPTAGKVNVANHSHGDEHVADHTYTVTVDDGGPVECTCPAFEYHCRPGEACKHMVAVTEPVLQAALASLTDDGDEDPDVRPDGGQQVAPEGEGDGRPADCECSGSALERDHGLPCFPCYRDGFETPNPAAGEGE